MAEVSTCPGQTYYLSVDNATFCPECNRAADAIRLNGGLTVEAGEDRLLVWGGDDVVEVLTGEVRRLEDALVDGRTPDRGSSLSLQSGGSE